MLQQSIIETILLAIGLMCSQYIYNENFQPKLYGIGDFCIIPMNTYNQNTGSYDVEVISSGSTTSKKCNV